MHASAIMRTLGKVIENMGHLEAVVPMLARLGRSHATMGVKPAYFTTLRACLLEALGEHLGPEKFTPDVAEVWGAAYDAIAAVIISHYDSEHGSGLAAVSDLGSQVVGF